MKKRIWLLGLCSYLFSIVNYALPLNLTPVATFSLGNDWVKTDLNQNVTLISPYQNRYKSTGHDTQVAVGLFLGVEKPIANILAQLGVDYYQNASFIVDGTVYQFDDPTLNNLQYQYRISSKRILLDGKLLFTLQKIIHPFITAGAGEAINSAYDYDETPKHSDDVAMTQGFDDKTYHAFTYEVGLGLDIDISTHLRFGIAYRYLDLGKAGLGTTPLQETDQMITFNHLHGHEIVAQLSFVG